MAEMSDFLRKSVASSAVLLRIGIFNRSPYEEVLVVRVHPDLLAAERLPAQARKHHVWARRYREINDWDGGRHDGSVVTRKH